LRAKDLADARFADALTVADLARAAGLSSAHFSREFRATFGESPHSYLLTRRLERAAALLRNTDRSVAAICMTVGLSSVGSFTTSFTRRPSPGSTASHRPPIGRPSRLRPRGRSCRPAWRVPTAGRRTARFEKTPAERDP